MYFLEAPRSEMLVDTPGRGVTGPAKGLREELETLCIEAPWPHCQGSGR